MEQTRSGFTKEILEALIESSNDCTVVVNRGGHIIYLNKAYCDFLEVDQQEVIGKPVQDVIENTRMHIVVETGQEEIADLQYIKGNYMVANRIPIFHNGEVVGALGKVIFRNPEEWKQMNTHIKSLLTELDYYRTEWQQRNGAKYSLNDIVTTSGKMEALKEQAKHIASSDISVLIRGETGTGKELFAHGIHQISERSEKPFVKVNCAAIPEHLFESELFGYEDGAFTGAKKGGKPGKFKVADGGTLFLDEIGELSLNMQVKLLRVLQEKEVEPIGAVSPVPVDVRLIAATNRPLEQLVEQGKFREDLFYRINVMPLHIPPLRERIEDIVPLADYLLKKAAQRTGKNVEGIDEETMALLKNHYWPGNVRELENVINTSVHLTEGKLVSSESLPDVLRSNLRIKHGGQTLKEMLNETEKRILKRSLTKHQFDKLKTAKELGISKSSLYEKLHKYELNE